MSNNAPVHADTPARRADVAEHPSLTISRFFKAPPALVYQAWTDPQKIVHWFGPDHGPVLHAEADVCVNGRYHVIFQTGDGEEHDVSGLYRVVEPDRRLTFTWSWRSMPERMSLVTVTMEPEGNGTRFTLLHEQFFDDVTRDAHNRGWTGCIAKLEQYLLAA